MKNLWLSHGLRRKVEEVSDVKTADCPFGNIPFFWVYHNGSRSVLLAFQHHSNGSSIQSCHINDIGSLTSPVDVAAVNINAEIIGLYF